jgi:hypothetical protein
MTQSEDADRYCATISERATYDYYFYKYVDGVIVDSWYAYRGTTTQNIYRATAESIGNSEAEGAWGILSE